MFSKLKSGRVAEGLNLLDVDREEERKKRKKERNDGS